MSAGQGSSQQPPGTSWTEPPWSGWIETTGDALLILEAARRGLIPRVTRRLVDSERKMITSGSVFVFDEDESGIKRWTDGFFWSPSRILGNFLLYRETDKRGAGHRGARSDPSSSELSEQPQYNVDGVKVEGQTLSRPKSDGGQMAIDKHRERTLVGSLTNSYKFKPDGLMKKTFSLTIGGVSQHLISYYKIEDVENGRLRSPSSLPELASLDISPEYLDKTHFRSPPKVEIGVDGIPRYRGEADDIETSPSLLSAPLSTGLPLITDGRADGPSSANKRGKRFDPYASPGPPRRSRKHSKSTPLHPSSADQLSPQPLGSSGPQPPHGYPDPNLPVVPHPHYSPYGPVPNYYQVSGYPVPPAPHPPPPHVYSSGSYSSSAPPPNGSSQHGPQQQGSNPPTPQYAYPGYPAPPPGDQPQSGGQSGQQQQQQQPYYSYYPPPPGAYPGFAGVAWPHYAGYPTQPAPQHQPSANVASEGEIKAGGDGDGVDRHDDGVDNKDT